MRFGSVYYTRTDALGINTIDGKPAPEGHGWPAKWQGVASSYYPKSLTPKILHTGPYITNALAEFVNDLAGLQVG